MHLGVGLRLEPVALGQEALLDLEVVLDDPVVDDHQRAAAVGVRVGVLLGGRPWVAQRVWPMPSAPASGRSREDALEHLDPAGGAPHVKGAPC